MHQPNISILVYPYFVFLLFIICLQFLFPSFFLSLFHIIPFLISLPCVSFSSIFLLIVLLLFLIHCVLFLSFFHNSFFAWFLSSHSLLYLRPFSFSASYFTHLFFFLSFLFLFLSPVFPTVCCVLLFHFL